MKRFAVLAAVVSVAIAIAATIATQTLALGDDSPSAESPDAAAVQRSRKQVQMLDNIYKQTIVLITDKYVHDVDDFAAGSAAVLLFKNISDSGFHTVRLIDATGEPYDSDNVAMDGFEKEGVEKLRAGAGVYEQVQNIDGKPQLRAITPVPVVMDKCIMCHEHYRDVEKGRPIGAISYTIPIE